MVMVSELVTNVILHATTGFELRVDRTTTIIRVEVTDHDDGRPTLQSPRPTDLHGRGLQIVNELSDRWGTSTAPGQPGKTVWFVIDLHRVEQRSELES
jgi:two-component sensor histidine kinase